MVESQEHLPSLFRPWAWFYRPDTPPPFLHPSTSARIALVFVMGGMMGLASSAISTVLVVIQSTLDITLPWGGWEALFVGRRYLIPGGVFGALVLVPVSRWQGRSWTRSLLAIPVACLIYTIVGSLVESVGPAMWLYRYDMLFKTENFNRILFLVLSQTAIAVGLATWMLSAARQNWKVSLGMATTVGILSGGLLVVVIEIMHNGTIDKLYELYLQVLPGDIGRYMFEFLLFVNLFAVFDVPMAIALLTKFLPRPRQGDLNSA